MQQYGDVDIYTSSFRPMRNTISGSPLRTFMKLVVDAASDKVVGCHMVGDDSAEIMQVGTGCRGSDRMSAVLTPLAFLGGSRCKGRSGAVE